MVGEIRDLETAEIAVQASLTGSLGVIDTAYQYGHWRRNSFKRIWALSDFYCPASLIGVIAQRLVRTLCLALCNVA